MKRRGYSLDEIATQTNGNTADVQESLFRYDAYASSVSMEEVDLAVNDVLIGNVRSVGKALQGALGATVKHSVRIGKKKNGDDKFRTTTRPDHATRLNAIERFAALSNVTRPKASGVAVNVNQQFNNGGGSAPPVGSRSFESHVRALREARGESNDEKIIDAEDLEDQSVQDELEGIGIDLDDDDDEDE